jgi:ATP-binding cassette subfamily B multidrug efflux pump
MSTAGKAFDGNLLKRIFRYASPYKKIFRSALLLTIALSLLGPVRPLMTQQILDHYIAGENVKGIVWMSMGMIGVLILQSFLQFFHSWNTNLLGQKSFGISEIHSLKKCKVSTCASLIKRP